MQDQFWSCIFFKLSSYRCFLLSNSFDCVFNYFAYAKSDVFAQRLEEHFVQGVI